MRIEELPLSGAKLIYPDIFADERGFFFESYSEPKYRKAGIDCPFVQDNHSRSGVGTVRGLHFQSSPGQAKLVSVIGGKVYDVIVDLRPNSPTFGKWNGVYLDSVEHVQLFVPIGFAHGFCVVSDVANVLYKVSSVYDAATECSIRWDDPDIGIGWPVKNAIISARDAAAQSFSQYRARIA